MTPERWQQVLDLLQAALDLEPAERSTLLDRQCAEDPQLRAEVESLLTSSKHSELFLETNAAVDHAFLLHDDHTETILAGTQIGPYVIQNKLGAGGMAEVYLANDVRLGRRVALKLLDNSLATQQTTHARFLREARLASTLDHPNICTVYEVGEAEGRPFIAMQFVDGQTLKQLINGRPLSIESLLTKALQIAEALATSHAQGIIHRDIKSANIMVNSQGHVRVLDFGLAKLLERADDQTNHDVTLSGAVIGTPGSMSPEQARGEATDERSDIFSFGVVLYEMATGSLPFKGRTRADVIGALLKEVHTPASQLNSEITPSLSLVIDRALQKDCAQRYQSIDEFIADLKNILRETGNFNSSETGRLIPSRNSRRESPSLWSRRIGLFGTSGVLLALLILGSYGLWRYRAHASKPSQPIPFAQADSRQLTTKGSVGWAALSPDGKFYSYILSERESREQSLWLGQTGASNDLRLRSSVGVYEGLAFAPDSKSLFFSFRGDQQSGFYKINMLGGVAERLNDRVDNSFALSPDGKELVYVRSNRQQNRIALLRVNIDGSNETELLSRPLEQAFTSSSLAWSPDASMIAFAAIDDPVKENRELFVLRLSDQHVMRLSSLEWSRMSTVVWRPDGSGLVTVASAKGEYRRHLWFVEYPSGNPQRLSRDTDGYGAALSLSADSKNLLAVQMKRESNIWIAPTSDLSKGEQITFSSMNGLDGQDGFDWRPDGGLVFTAGIDRSIALYTMDASGDNLKQITSAGFWDQRPRLTSDGRYIVFQSNRSESSEIWRVKPDGSDLRQLTTGGGNGAPQTTFDNKIVYVSTRGGKSTLWRMPVNGGEPQQITTEDSFDPTISPDGNSIACGYRYQGSLRIAILAIDGGNPHKLLPVPGFASLVDGIRWTPDGKAIVFRDTDRGIWRQDLSGGEPRKLEGLPDEGVFRFAWSRDGKQFAFTRGRSIGDVVLFRDRT